jgi:glucokinase
MSTSPYFIGLDVGGSSMKAGVVDDKGRPQSGVSLPTEAHRGQAFGLERMCETIRAAASAAGMDMKQIAAIGVATPGTMDLKAGIILDPPNLQPWQNVPVRDHVQSVFGLPTAFENDANAAACGEFWAGAGRSMRSLVMFTLGTGVGGGIIVNGDGQGKGQVLQGEHSHGAEVGHMRIELTKPRRCGCGRWGCLEAYASASAVVRRTREALERDGGKSTLHGVLRQQGELTCRDIFDAASGDELAAQIVEETAFYLAVAATNLMHLIDPDMIVFSGGMIAAGTSFLERIRSHVQQLAFPVPARQTQIRYAELGTDAGFIGAAACARQIYLGRG